MVFISCIELFSAGVWPGLAHTEDKELERLSEALKKSLEHTRADSTTRKYGYAFDRWRSWATSRSGGQVIPSYTRAFMPVFAALEGGDWVESSSRRSSECCGLGPSDCRSGKCVGAPPSKGDSSSNAEDFGKASEEEGASDSEHVAAYGAGDGAKSIIVSCANDGGLFASICRFPEI